MSDALRHRMNASKAKKEASAAKAFDGAAMKHGNSLVSKRR
jgi:hypothetical protein